MLAKVFAVYDATVANPFAAIALGLIGFYFFLFAGGGIWADFSPDDLMNLHHAEVRSVWKLVAENLTFFSSVRPLGALFYKSVYELFRLNPFPLHLACFLLASVNVWILFALSGRLSGSYEIGSFSALIGAFHTNFLTLYYNAGTCYDLMSFTAYYGALLYYLSIRQRNCYPTAGQSIAILFLYICALNAKEISITLPVVMAAYELIYHPPRKSVHAIAAWIRREGRVTMLALPVMAAYAAGKLYGAESLTQFGDYNPAVSPLSYVRGLGHYLDEVFYQVGYFTPGKTLIFCGVLLFLILLTRSKYLRFSFALLLIGLTPIAFIRPRALYAAYVPVAGLWAFGAVVLMRFRQSLNRLFLKSEAGILLTQLLVFGMAAGFLIRTHIHAGAFDVGWITGQEQEIRRTIQSLDRLNLTLQKDAHVLIVYDPFDSYSWGQWLSFYLIRLYYHDPAIEVEKCSATSESMAPYAAVLTYDDEELVRVTGCQGRSCCP